MMLQEKYTSCIHAYAHLFMYTFFKHPPFLLSYFRFLKGPSVYVTLLLSYCPHIEDC